MRKTIASQVEFRGVGLHGGKPALMQIAPAPAGSGIVFLRTDVDGAKGRIPARYDLVSDTRLCTQITNEHGVTVSTVEHIMAALAGCGISDALIRLAGQEVPIMDGSSRAFVAAFRRVGIRSLGRAREAIRILEPVEVVSNGRLARLTPAALPQISFMIDFPDPAIGRQSRSVEVTGDVFGEELAECRTFCMLKEVEALREIGLARGGSLDNAIVVDAGRVLNPEGLRRPDEFVRHKILDAVGDLALAEAPIIGRYEGVRAGHEMTNLLLRELFARTEAWEWVTCAPSMLPRIGSADRRSRDEGQALAV